MLGLRTVVYHVQSIEEAKLWYSKVFETEPYFDEPYYVGFNIAGYELGLLPKETETRNGESVSVIAYWGVNDIQVAYEKAIALGAKKYEEPNNVGGELMVCTVFDPWQNAIGFIYNPYFKLK